MTPQTSASVHPFLSRSGPTACLLPIRVLTPARLPREIYVPVSTSLPDLSRGMSQAPQPCHVPTPTPHLRKQEAHPPRRSGPKPGIPPKRRTFPRSCSLQDLCTCKSLGLKGFPPRLYPVPSHPSCGSGSDGISLEKRPLHIPNDTRTHALPSLLRSQVLGTTGRHLTDYALISFVCLWSLGCAVCVPQGHFLWLWPLACPAYNRAWHIVGVS